VALHIEEKIVDLALLASFDRDYATWMAKSEVLARFNRQDCREKRIAIVVRTSSVKKTVFDHWITRVSGPTLTEWLLIHVTVHEYSLVLADRGAACFGCNINDQERGSSWLLNWLDSHTFDVLRLSKLDEMIHLTEQVPIRLPLRVEYRRERRDTNELF